MTLVGWLIGFGLFWVAGYLETKQTDHALWIRVPRFALPLLGFVKSPQHPLGIVSAKGLWGQLSGILILAYRLMPATLLPQFMQEWDVIVALVLAFSLSTILVWLLMWRCRYRPSVEE
jgi:xanthine/uracil permease